MAGVNNLGNIPNALFAGQTAATAHGIVIAEGASAVASVVLTAGQVLIGTTASDPAGATLTAGAGINVTSASGSITITNTSAAGGLATVNQTAAAVTMAVNTQYINTSAANAQVTYTLPGVAAQGSIFRVIGVTGNSGGWVIQAAAAQTIWVGNTVSTTAGSVTFGQSTDNLTICCTVANTVFVAIEGVTSDVTLA